MRAALVTILLAGAPLLLTAPHPHPMPSTAPTSPVHRMSPMRGMRGAPAHPDRASWPPERMTAPSRPGTVVYHLDVSDTMVRYTGKERMAIAINGTIPGPTLYFTEGDTAEIYIHNSMGMET